MVFNPSSVERLMHTLGGAWAAGAFLALSVGAWYLLKNKHHDFAKATMKIGLCVALFSGFWQLATGHEAAMVVAKHQPAKMAAMEGHYDSSQPAPLSFGGWVDEKNEKTIAPGIPGGTSFLLYGDFSKPMPGLDAFKKEDRPPVNITFQSFHLMVALGMAMLGLSALGLLMWWRGSLWTCRPVLWLFVASVLAPQLANQAGWYTAEVGRQPWVVYNLLRTSDALSEAVTAGHVMSSIIMFSLIYLLLFILFLYLLNEKIQKGPGHYDTLPYHHDNPLAGRGGSDELPATPGV
jgi:cytochrome d ubiquinol oxidase subunit I